MFILIISFSLAVFAVIINGVTQLFYARTLGYKLKPTGLAYFIGAIGNLLSGNLVPISGQAETLAVTGLIKDINVRVAALLIAAFVGIILGITQSISVFVSLAGEIVIIGMMAGVGLILSEVSITLIRQNYKVGLLSFSIALLMWLTTHDLVYTIAASVIISSVYYVIMSRDIIKAQSISNVEKIEWRFWRKKYWNEFQLVRPVFNHTAWIGALGIICLNIGTNISFGTITSSIANVTPKLDALTLVNSLADIPSVLLGGIPIEAIISGTAASPWPFTAGIVMMTLTGALLLTGIIDRIAHLIPAQSIAGFLFVIGFNLTLIPNFLTVASSHNVLEGIVAASITMLTKNAFFGVIAGMLVHAFRLFGGI